MGARKPIKILIATGLYPPDIGGPATHVVFLEKNLPKDQFSLTVVPFGAVRKYPKLVRHVVYAWHLWRHAKNVDIVYALDPVSVGLPALLVAKLKSKPFLLRLGGDYAWEQGQQRFGLTLTLDQYIQDQKSAPVAARLLAVIQKFVSGRAIKVIAPSHYLKSIIQTWGVSEEKISVIYSVLFPLPTLPSREVIREKLNYSFPTLLSAGRLVPWKGYRCLIDVVENMKLTYPSIKLLIAGDGVDGNSLKAYVATKNLEETVLFVGKLNKSELGEAKKAADVFVLNTAYEGLSHEILEVMEIGTPVITTSIGGNRELIEDGISGLLVDFNDQKGITDAIEKILSDESLRSRLVNNAKEKTGEFSETVILSQFISLFNSIYCE